MPYMPGASSLAGARREKVKYYRQSVLRDTQLTSDSRSCILQFEKESVAHDSLQKETQSEFVVTICTDYMPFTPSNSFQAIT